MSIRDGVTRRGTSNGNQRGSAHDRRVRKQWLIETFGDGQVVACYRVELGLCDRVELVFETVTVDRIVPGAHGGRYVRGNIRPACGPCNSETGGRVRRLAHDDDDG